MTASGKSAHRSERSYFENPAEWESAEQVARRGRSGDVPGEIARQEPRRLLELVNQPCEIDSTMPIRPRMHRQSMNRSSEARRQVRDGAINLSRRRCPENQRPQHKVRLERFTIGLHTRSQALPGNALLCRLCLPDRTWMWQEPRGRASRAVRSQAEPGNETVCNACENRSGRPRTRTSDHEYANGSRCGGNHLLQARRRFGASRLFLQQLLDTSVIHPDDWGNLPKETCDQLFLLGDRNGLLHRLGELQLDQCVPGRPHQGGDVAKSGIWKLPRAGKHGVRRQQCGIRSGTFVAAPQGCR